MHSRWRRRRWSARAHIVPSSHIHACGASKNCVGDSRHEKGLTSDSFCYSYVVEQAVKEAVVAGYDPEVIDLISLKPFDQATITVRARVAVDPSCSSQPSDFLGVARTELREEDPPGDCCGGVHAQRRHWRLHQRVDKRELVGGVGSRGCSPVFPGCAHSIRKAARGWCGLQTLLCPLLMPVY